MAERETGYNREQGESDESEAALARLTELYNGYEQLDKFKKGDFNVGGKLRKEFSQTFHPIRVGVENAMDRKRAAGSMAQPPIELREAGVGDLLFIPTEGETFAAVPQFGTPYTLVRHEFGGMKELFDVVGFDDPKQQYSIRLKKPAMCERDDQGQFRILEKGQLELTAVS